MALTDIDFNQGEGQDFVTEIVSGTLNAPTDVIIEASGAQYPVTEIAGSSSSGSIFIMVD